MTTDIQSSENVFAVLNVITGLADFVPFQVRIDRKGKLVLDYEFPENFPVTWTSAPTEPIVFVNGKVNIGTVKFTDIGPYYTAGWLKVELGAERVDVMLQGKGFCQFKWRKGNRERLVIVRNAGDYVEFLRQTSQRPSQAIEGLRTGQIKCTGHDWGHDVSYTDEMGRSRMVRFAPDGTAKTYERVDIKYEDTFNSQGVISSIKEDNSR